MNIISETDSQNEPENNLEKSEVELIGDRLGEQFLDTVASEFKRKFRKFILIILGVFAALASNLLLGIIYSHAHVFVSYLVSLLTLGFAVTVYLMAIFIANHIHILHKLARIPEKVTIKTEKYDATKLSNKEKVEHLYASIATVDGMFSFLLLTSGCIVTQFFAWFSLELQQLELNDFSPIANVVSRGEINNEGKPFLYFMFLKYYMYNFLDLIPLLKINETYGLRSAIKQSGPISGTLLLAYKIVIIFYFAACVKIWLSAKSRE